MPETIEEVNAEGQQHEGASTTNGGGRKKSARKMKGGIKGDPPEVTIATDAAKVSWYGGRKKSARKMKGGTGPFADNALEINKHLGGGRKKSAWNMLVQQVYKAEKSINPNFQFKDALKKASSLKKSGNYGPMMSNSKTMRARKTSGRRMKGSKTRKRGGWTEPVDLQST